MSRGVDVLDALRQIADGEGDAQVFAMRVHAAVAELIEAADQAHAFLCEKAPATATEYRVRSALARVRGAA